MSFLMNSNESIWQLQPVNVGKNTEDGFTFIIPETGRSDQNPVCLSAELLNGFEIGDERKISWIDTAIINGDTFYFPYKYKIATSDAPIEYLMVFTFVRAIPDSCRSMTSTG